jgi:hypothetical protein
MIHDLNYMYDTFFKHAILLMRSYSNCSLPNIHVCMRYHTSSPMHVGVFTCTDSTVHPVPFRLFRLYLSLSRLLNTEVIHFTCPSLHFHFSIF